MYPECDHKICIRISGNGDLLSKISDDIGVKPSQHGRVPVSERMFSVFEITPRSLANLEEGVLKLAQIVERHVTQHIKSRDIYDAWIIVELYEFAIINFECETFSKLADAMCDLSIENYID